MLHRALLAPLTAAALLLAAPTRPSLGQNLLNANFENWTGNSPVSWLVQHGSGTFGFAPIDAGAEPEKVLCGRRSAHVWRQGPGWTHLGKQWTNVPVGTTLTAHVRFLCPPHAPAPATVRVRAGVFDANWNFVGGPEHIVTPSLEWQELTLTYTTVQAPAPNMRLRLLFDVSMPSAALGTDRVDLYVDNVDFSGSSAHLGLPETALCHDVRGQELGATIDLGRGHIRELRRLDNAQQVTGPNLLVDWNSPLAALRIADDNSFGDEPAWRNLALMAGSSVGPMWELNSALSSPNKLHLRSRHASINWSAADALSLADNVELEVVVERDPSGSGIQFTHLLGPTGSAGSAIIEGVAAPVLRFRDIRSNPLGTEEDWLFLPTGDGSTVRLKEQRANATWTDSSVAYGMKYPGHASMQFAAYYSDATGGIMHWCADPSGETKDLRVRYYKPSSPADTHHTEFAWWHKLPAVLPEQQSYTPFPTVVELGGTDWMTYAERYRSWARGMPWYTKARARTEDLSPWIRGRPTVVEADLLPQGMGSELVPIDQWACVLGLWANALSTSAIPPKNVMPLFRSFENRGTYASPFYFPLRVVSTDLLPTGEYGTLRSEAEVHSAWDDINTAGYSAGAMISGLKYVYERKELAPCATTPGASSAYWVNQIATTMPAIPSALVRDRKNSLVLTTSTASWAPDHYSIDPTSPAGAALHPAVGQTLSRDGRIDLYLFDQLPRHEGLLRDDYGPRYTAAGATHPPGDGRWKTEALDQLFAGTLAAGRAKNANFELGIEDPNEWTLPWIAMQGIRINKTSGWPAWNDPTSTANQRAGGSIVPAFSFVYSDASAQWIWDLRMGARDATPGWFGPQIQYWERRTAYMEGLARAVASGARSYVSIEPWQLVKQMAIELGVSTLCATTLTRAPCGGDSMAMTPANADQDLLSFARAVVVTEQGPAKPFLNDGSLIRTDGFQLIGAGVNFSLNAWRAIDASSQGRTSLPVVHSAWQLGTSRALFLAQTDGSQTPSNSTVQLPTHYDGVAVGNPTVTLYLNGLLQGSAPYSNIHTLFPASAQLGGPHVILRPGDVAFLVF